MTSEDTSTTILDPFPGRVIAGNFRVQRLIGSGAMGNVYQAEQLSLGKNVAVKILHAHLADDEKLVRRFQREAKSASRLNHPNSIQIIDSGRDADGSLFIAMELLAGRDLARVIREEFPLPLPRIVRILSQVLSALDEAHAQGVIHRDLKPSNIMLIERRGQPDFVKVCDYGIAKAQMEDGYAEPQMLTIQGLVCGTPEYMSPEQARGEPLDGRTDVYSAAVILFQLVTGDIPFHGNTPLAIVSRHLSESPPLPSSRRTDPKLPADLDDLIMRGLAKNRELRPATAAVFREELENVGAGRVGRRARSSAVTLPATRSVDGESLNGRAFRSGAREEPATTAEVRRTGSARTVLLAVAAALAVAGAVVVVAGRARLPPARSPAVALLPPPTTSPPPARAASGAESQAGMNLAPRTTTAALVVTEARGASPGAGRAHPAASREPELPRSRANAHRDRAPTGSGAPLAARALPTTAAGGAPAEGTASPPRAEVAEAEALLGQGEVAAACQRGEDIRASAPALPEIYRFLGKCYMRSGNSARAKDNYRRYLQLDPHGPDALFIESIVK
jgi:tRNA A-37 threonylcarbamoyl transferase component Bud32